MAKKNIFGGLIKYFKEVRAEFKKVIWPSFKQIRNNTGIVIVMVLLVGLIIGLLDMFFSWGLRELINLQGSTGFTVL